MNILLIVFLWLHLSVFCHEMGHFTVAKIVGFNPYLVKIGNGKKIGHMKLLNSLIEFRLIPGGGITYVSNLTLKKIKQKLIYLYLGGPITNCLLVFILCALKSNQNTLNSIIIKSLIDLEIIMIIFNLFPSKFYLYGVSQLTDGGKIIEILNTNESILIQKIRKGRRI